MYKMDFGFCSHGIFIISRYIRFLLRNFLIQCKDFKRVSVCDFVHFNSLYRLSLYTNRNSNFCFLSVSDFNSFQIQI